MSADVPEAIEKPSRGPGWIWAVPIAAVAIVGYLAFQQLSQSGPDVTVIFPTGGDIKASDTKVKYEGAEIGEVESVKFEKDLKHMDTVLRLHVDMAGHLGPGTRFWVAGSKPSITDLASLKSVIAGAYIGVEPHSGKRQNHYDGLAERPISANDAKATDFVLQAATLGNIARGSSIFYRDLRVGQVTGTALESDNRSFRVDAIINAPFDKLVHEDTRFWDASAVHLSMAGNGPSVQFQSVPALFEGALGFETPTYGSAVPMAKPGATFKVYANRDAAEHAPDSRAVRYRVIFRAVDAGALEVGASVSLEKRRVGSVTESHLQYDERNGRLETTVILALEPADISLVSGAAWAADPKPQMDAFLQHLIAQGLRARLGSSIPIVGGKDVELEFVSQTASASLGTGDIPEIPTGRASGVDGIMASVDAVAAKINAIPLDQIASDIHTATKHIAAISGEPQITNSLNHLDASMANVEQITRDTKTQVDPLLTELRRVAHEAQATVAAAHTLIGSNALAQNKPDAADLGDTLYELGRAARSLRELTDFLDRHPEALIRGKG